MPVDYIRNTCTASSCHAQTAIRVQYSNDVGKHLFARTTWPYLLSTLFAESFAIGNESLLPVLVCLQWCSLAHSVAPMVSTPQTPGGVSGLTPNRVSPFLRYTRTVVVIGAWYCISASIILIQKWLMSGSENPTKKQNTLLFPCPLTIAFIANTLVSLWALLFTRAPRFRPSPLTYEQFRQYVLPIGVTIAFEIGCSNLALLLLTVSFGTILKGGAPVFTLLAGIVLGIESFSLPVSGAVLLIAGGITLASVGEGSDFVLLGFLLQLAATALGGFRWALTHILLKGEPANIMPPLTAILYTSPTTAACVLPFALVLESSTVVAHVRELDGPGAWHLAGLLFIIATLVFLILMSEYWLLTDTSSLALSVAGVFKECMTIGGGILFFNDKFTPLNFVGFIICQIGIALYIWLRYDPDDNPTASSSAPAADYGDGVYQPLGSYRRIGEEGFGVDDPWDASNSPLPPKIVSAAGAGL